MIYEVKQQLVLLVIGWVTASQLSRVQISKAQFFKNQYKTTLTNPTPPLNTFIEIKCPKTTFIKHFWDIFRSKITKLL